MAAGLGKGEGPFNAGTGSHSGSGHLSSCLGSLDLHDGHGRRIAR